MRIFQLSDHEIPYRHFLHFFLIIFCVSSNNACWIPGFRILFVLHSFRTVPRNLSLLICTTLYSYCSSSPSWNFNTSAHWNCWKATEIFIIYNCTVLLTITPRSTAPYFQGQAAMLKYGIWDIFVRKVVRWLVNEQYDGAWNTRSKNRSKTIP
jgi:hypothetical protein